MPIMAGWTRTTRFRLIPTTTPTTYTRSNGQIATQFPVLDRSMMQHAHTGSNRKAETEVESNQKALNAVDPAFEHSGNLPASPALPGRRCDQFRRALTAPARRDCDSIVTSGRS